jgi:hypothetical protein
MITRLDGERLTCNGWLFDRRGAQFAIEIEQQP